MMVPRAATCSTKHSGSTAARCRRIAVRLMVAQLEGGRQAVLYTNMRSPVWDSEEFVGLLRDHKLQNTQLRWCNIGIDSPVSGLGINTVTRIA